jgi:hypothetical protein
MSLEEMGDVMWIYFVILLVEEGRDAMYISRKRRLTTTTQQT